LILIPFPISNPIHRHHNAFQRKNKPSNRPGGALRIIPSFNPAPKNHLQNPFKIEKAGPQPAFIISPARIGAPGRTNHPMPRPENRISPPKRITAQSAISPVAPQASWTAPEPAGGDKPARVTQAPINAPKTVLKPLRARQTPDGINPLPRIRKNG